MKRYVVALGLGLALVLGLAATRGDTAHAQNDPDPAASEPAPPQAQPTPPTTPPPVDPSLLTERHMRQPEILHERPSGFWTSNRPAIGGAYRYRLLLLGVVIAAIMATVMIVVIRRNTRRPA